MPGNCPRSMQRLIGVMDVLFVAPTKVENTENLNVRENQKKSPNYDLPQGTLTDVVSLAAALNFFANTPCHPTC